jgi:hypothetical protein
VACGLGFTADQCRARHIALKLRDAKPDGADYEARCPVCGHLAFRVSAAREKRYRNVWTCACKPRHCEPGAMRTALLALGVMPGCLGFYAASAKASADPNMAARLDAATADILDAPHLKPSDMRIILAEARGRKVPGEFRQFVKWAMSIGIGRTQAYEAAARWCRPADASSSPEGGVVDTGS